MAALRGEAGEPRWIPPERWHLTLVFLGSVAAGKLPAITQAAAPPAAGARPMRLQLAGGGRFGSRRRPQVAWVGVTGDLAALGDVARALSRAMRHLRLELEDRPFRAHLTVGRWRPGQPADAGLLDRLAAYAGPVWPVTELRLLESHLGPAPRYDVVATWPLVTP